MDDQNKFPISDRSLYQLLAFLLCSTNTYNRLHPADTGLNMDALKQPYHQK